MDYKAESGCILQDALFLVIKRPFIKGETGGLGISGHSSKTVNQT